MASAFTYAGGIVLNDVFDYEIDLAGTPEPAASFGPDRVDDWRQRWGQPFWPLVWLLAYLSGTPRAWLVELALIACVLAYDAGVKRLGARPEVDGDLSRAERPAWDEPVRHVRRPDRLARRRGVCGRS